jgi:hypothetical protein
VFEVEAVVRLWPVPATVQLKVAYLEIVLFDLYSVSVWLVAEYLVSVPLGVVEYSVSVLPGLACCASVAECFAAVWLAYSEVSADASDLRSWFEAARTAFVVLSAVAMKQT